MRYYSSIEQKKFNEYKNIIAEHFTGKRSTTKIMMCFTSGVPVKTRVTVIVRGGGVSSYFREYTPYEIHKNIARCL